MRADIAFGTCGGTVSPWIEPNANGCIFHAGRVLGQVRVSQCASLATTDGAVFSRAKLVAGDRMVVAVVAGEHEPLGVPRIEDIDARIEVSDEAWRTWAGGLQYE